MTTIVERAQARAITIDPRRIALDVLVSPLWLVGWLVGAVWVALRFLGGVVAVGFDDARGRRLSGDS